MLRSCLSSSSYETRSFLFHFWLKKKQKTKYEAKTVFMVCIFYVSNNSIRLNDGMLTVLALTFLRGYRWVLCAPGSCCQKAHSQILDPWAGLWSRTPSQSFYHLSSNIFGVLIIAPQIPLALIWRVCDPQQNCADRSEYVCISTSLTWAFQPPGLLHRSVYGYFSAFPYLWV